MSKSTTVEMILRARDEASLTFEQVGKLTENLAKLQKTLATEFLGTGKAAAELEKEMGRVGRAEKSITDMARSLDKLADTRTKLAELGTAAEQLKGKLAGIEGAAFEAQSRGVSPKVLADMAKLGQAAERTAQQIAQAETRLAALGGKIIAGTATESQRASFDAVRAKIAELEQDYRLITREAEKAGAALKTSLGPIPNDLNAALRKTGAELRKTEADMARAAQAANRLEQELTEAGVDTRDLAAAQQRLAGTAGQLKAAQEGVAGATTRAGAAQDRFASDSRTALNITQRLRGQVLSLISAYVGLYGAAQQVAEVFNTTSRIEGMESRFNVSFGGDLSKTAEEMRFVREEGERLKLNWLSLGESYSRFLTALPPGAMALEDTRKIFTGFATAARVARLSTDDTNGIFVALTQMASKGTISMEELRQQLGDRLPGAVNLFAEAAGFGQDEIGKFFKAVEQGQVPASIMVRAAELIEQKYGGELPGALDSASAALGEFENAVTEVRLAAAESGFVETLTAALNDLAATLRDPGTQDNLVTLAKGVGALIEGLVALTPYLTEIIGLFLALQGIKVAAWFTTIATGVKTFNLSLAGTAKSLPVLARGIATFLGSLSPLGKVVLAVAGAWALMNGMAPELANSFDGVRGKIEDLTGEFEKLSAVEEPKALSNNQLKKAIEDREKLLADSAERVKAIQADLSPESGPPLLLRRGEADEAAASLLKVQQQVAGYTKELEALRAEEAARSGATTGPLFTGELTNTKDNIRAVTEALLALEDINADSAIQRLNAAFDDTARAMADAGRSGAALAQLERERAEARVAVEKYRADRTVQILAAEAAAKLDLLRAEGLQGEDLAMAQREIVAEVADFRISETQRAIEAVGNELEKAKQLERNYADEVKRLNSAITAELERQSDVRAEFGGDSSFAAYQRYQEQRLRAAKLAADTERALEEGNYKLAEELARKREALAKQMAETEIIGEKTGQKIVANEDARAEAARTILDAHKQINEAMAGQKDEAQAAADAQAELVRNLTSGLEELNGTLVSLQGEKIELNTVVDADELNAQIARIRTEAYATPLTTKLELDDQAALIKLAELQKPTESTHTVKLALDTSGLPMRLASLGAEALKGLFPFIGGRAAGGKIEGPGTTTSDSILARLSRGEYVIKAAAVDYWGEDMIRRINMMQRLPLYATGGMAGSAPDLVAPLAGGAGGEVVTHRFEVGGKTIGDLTGERDVVDNLIDALRRLK